MSTEHQQHIKQDLLINGNFATGDTTGWDVPDPETYFVTLPEGKPTLVIMPSPAFTWMSQTFRSGSGVYLASFWAAAVTEAGEVARGEMRVMIPQIFVRPDAPDESTAILPMAALFDKWTKFAFQITYETAGDLSTWEFMLQNRIDSVAPMPDGLSSKQLVTGPIGIRDVILWKKA